MKARRADRPAGLSPTETPSGRRVGFNKILLPGTTPFLLTDLRLPRYCGGADFGSRGLRTQAMVTTSTRDAVLVKIVVILDRVRSNGQYRPRKPMVRAHLELRRASSKALRAQERNRSIIKKIWRWIRYYCRRKKMHLRDGTVLMPSIRFYDLLDLASGDEDARKRLP